MRNAIPIRSFAWAIGLLGLLGAVCALGASPPEPPSDVGLATEQAPGPDGAKVESVERPVESQVPAVAPTLSNAPEVVEKKDDYVTVNQFGINSRRAEAFTEGIKSSTMSSRSALWAALIVLFFSGCAAIVTTWKK